MRSHGKRPRRRFRSAKLVIKIKGKSLLRVIRCLPSPGQHGAFRGQASDKPQGRKPRAGLCRTVLRQSYGDLRATGSWLRREYRDRRRGAAACDRSDGATRCSERVAIAIVEGATWRTAPVIGRVGSRPVDAKWQLRAGFRRRDQATAIMSCRCGFEVLGDTAAHNRARRPR
jgi:hypothetical protein